MYSDFLCVYLICNLQHPQVAALTWAVADCNAINLQVVGTAEHLQVTHKCAILAGTGVRTRSPSLMVEISKHLLNSTLQTAVHVCFQ